MQKREKEFDIFKGFLIIAVIIGHLPINPFCCFDVYWFHMPAFFMISGYFYKPKPDIPVYQTLKGYALRYIIPYLFFSFILFIIFIPENFGKSVLRIIYGGLINVTEITYPFWFINALFIALSISLLLDRLKSKYVLLLIIYIYLFIHTSVYSNFPYKLPWAIELSLGALCYIYAGRYIRKYRGQTFCLEYIIPGIMILVVYFGLYSYRLDMAGKLYQNIILDIVIPLSFYFFFLRISKVVKEVPHFGDLFALLGECCITIFFCHAAMISVMKHSNLHYFVQILICCTLGIGIHKALEQNILLRKVCLGRTS